MGAIVLNDNLMSRLADDAAARGVAVDTRAAEIIAAALGKSSRAGLRAEADRIAAMTPKGVAQTPAEVLIREDRDR